jgi:excisionase family DNA binding protein
MTQPETSPNPLLVTVAEAARVLAVGRTTLYELIGSGQLATVHIGRAVRVPMDELRSFVSKRSEGAAPRTTRESRLEPVVVRGDAPHNRT